MKPTQYSKYASPVCCNTNNVRLAAYCRSLDHFDRDTLGMGYLNPYLTRGKERITMKETTKPGLTKEKTPEDYIRELRELLQQRRRSAVITPIVEEKP